jgi:hypothetical protein
MKWVTDRGMEVKVGVSVPSLRFGRISGKRGRPGSWGKLLKRYEGAAELKARAQLAWGLEDEAAVCWFVE